MKYITIFMKNYLVDDFHVCYFFFFFYILNTIITIYGKYLRNGLNRNIS